MCDDVVGGYETYGAEHAVGFPGDEERCRAGFSHQFARLKHARLMIDMDEQLTYNFAVSDVGRYGRVHLITLQDGLAIWTRASSGRDAGLKPTNAGSTMVGDGNVVSK